MHPIGGEQVGWADVQRSFEQVAGKIVHHHTDMSTAMLEILQRLRAA